MIEAVFLDAGPLGLITSPKESPASLAAIQWSVRLIRSGCRLLVPAIADYEVRRELIRLGKTKGIASLDVFNVANPNRFVPIEQKDLIRAAALWAQARNAGTPTSDPKELDCDAILAAQVLNSNLADARVVVATTNVGHLSQFVSAQFWSSIEA